jgi:hypothetical protein
MANWSSISLVTSVSSTTSTGPAGGASRAVRWASVSRVTGVSSRGAARMPDASRRASTTGRLGVAFAR